MSASRAGRQPNAESPCREPLCSKFAEEGKRGRCAEHSTEWNRELKARTPDRATVYNTKRWRALRKAVLRRDRYTCAVCKRWGDEVDHIVSITDGGDEWDQDNLQTLCGSCHFRKTSGEISARRSGR